MFHLKIQLLFIAIVGSFFGFTQQWTTFKLDDKLNEISGLEQLDESTLVAINDSGSGAELHVLNMEGKILKTVAVKNATNIDWEDLARDNDYLYIGDIGNNENKRKNLCVYKVRIADILSKKEVVAQKISFNYSNQNEFPPNKSQLNFDAEGMIVYKESIYIFSKNRTEPWTGISNIYTLPKQKGTYNAKKYSELYVGEQGWWQDAITGADILNDQLYVLTYGRIFQLNIADLDRKPTFSHEFKRTTQKEAVVVINHSTILLADEVKKIIGGGKLYKFEK
ncbi:MAG: hypothetical protein QNL61_05980 [Crocinitomicaceae bacterium]